MEQTVNRNYKDTVFRMLFSKPEHALSLYNSLNGTSYTDVGGLSYNTLENAIYMNVKNDVSILVGHRMSLYEHQSTWNPNLPLRDLFYSADLLQGYMKDWSIYGTKLRRIPTPELRVKVLNINPGKNEKLKQDCPVLGEYMTYVGKVRAYAQEMELREAVERAVGECISEGILSEFLRQQKMEVVKVSIYEYDEEREMRLIRADEREIGMEMGLEAGREEGREEGREVGIRGMISIAKKAGWTKEETVQQLQEELGISKEEAEVYVEKFWEA